MGVGGGGMEWENSIQDTQYLFRFLFATTVTTLLHTLPRVALFHGPAVSNDLHTPMNGDVCLFLKWEANKTIEMLDGHPWSGYTCNDGVHAVEDVTCLVLALPRVCYLEVHKVTNLGGDRALLLETVKTHIGSLV